LLGVILCLVPFFLGSSRGSIFAVTFPFIIYLLYSKGIRNKIRLIFLAVIFILVLILSTNFLGHGVFDRFTSIFEDFNTGSSSAIRVEFWKDGLRQFAEHPFFGNSLQSEYALFHPHNIFIEILLSTGLFGFIPFFIFIVIIFRNIIAILKTKQEYFWVTNIFIIGFIQNMFSGAIWGAGWTMMGAAMIISIVKYNPQEMHQPF
jgi:O-antigen ligase